VIPSPINTDRVFGTHRRLNRNQGQLFYSFNLNDAVPDDHQLREIAAVLDLSWVHAELASYYAAILSTSSRASGCAQNPVSANAHEYRQAAGANTSSGTHSFLIWINLLAVCASTIASAMTWNSLPLSWSGLAASFFSNWLAAGPPSIEFSDAGHIASSDKTIV
jgi:hypothetical protein